MMYLSATHPCFSSNTWGQWWSDLTVQLLMIGGAYER